MDIATFHCGQQWLGLPREQVVEAVDSERLRAVPGSPPWHAGLLMFHDTPIVVVDVARLLDNSNCASGTDVIIAQLPNSSTCVGLRVDELGGIPEIQASEILAMGDVAHQSRAAIVDRAVRPARVGQPVLFILNLQQLMTRIQSGIRD